MPSRARILGYPPQLQGTVCRHGLLRRDGYSRGSRAVFASAAAKSPSLAGTSSSTSSAMASHNFGDMSSAAGSSRISACTTVQPAISCVHHSPCGRAIGSARIGSRVCAPSARGAPSIHLTHELMYPRSRGDAVDRARDHEQRKRSLASARKHCDRAVALIHVSRGAPTLSSTS
jgi:hypothetical protein